MACAECVGDGVVGACFGDEADLVSGGVGIAGTGAAAIGFGRGTAGDGRGGAAACLGAGTGDIAGREEVAGWAASATRGGVAGFTPVPMLGSDGGTGNAAASSVPTAPIAPAERNHKPNFMSYLAHSFATEPTPIQ
jgi:hypothetical protein